MKVKKLKNSKLRLLTQYFKFICGGIGVAILQFLIIITVTEIFKVNFYYPYIAVLLLGIVSGYFYHKKVTFKSKGKTTSQGPIYLIVSGIFFSLSLNSAYIFHEVIGFNYRITVIVTAIIISILSFYINKRYVFKT